MTSVPSGYSVTRHGKLHKRNDSGSSFPPPTSRPSAAIKHDSPLEPAYGATSSKTGTTERIKPYLRMMSLRDDDEAQGRLDLSRPSMDSDTVSGLGIRDFSGSARSVSDVSLLPSVHRRSTHRRATSLSSQLSVVRSSPRPPTPPSAFSTSTFPHADDEVEESTDVLAGELRCTSLDPWRFRRTASTNSAPYGLSTVSSKTHSAGSLTRLTNGSQSNLSTRSTNSIGSTREAQTGHPRGSAAKSLDLGTTTSSRTSFDKAFTRSVRNAEPEDPATRAANIRALRRAFEEKQAAKERKYEKEELKRRDTEETKRAKKEDWQRRKSETIERIRHRRSTSGSLSLGGFNEKAASDQARPNHRQTLSLSLPIQGVLDEESELRAKTEMSKTKAAKSVWVRFRAWSRTRMLNCY